MRRFLVAVSMVGALSVATPPAHAAVITASELIADTTCTATNLTACADGTRDLTRVRTLSGSPTTESTDATIVSENSVSSTFGVYTNDEITYTHDLTWISPLPTFDTVTLTLMAYDANGNSQNNANDPVLADNLPLGNLLIGAGTIQTTVFNNTANLSLAVVDGMLTVTLTPSPGAGPSVDNLNLFSSKLEVTYTADDTIRPVPEPGSLVLLGSGLLLMARRLRRRPS